ncbi:hypothetical protein NPIL_340811 [Nephila pilipes]|uniref:Uncharacterized protein n=1 Tax=Nephila pilipes TaxID=299642 RepID=A0A8X6I6E0_NEPPI|nr:hypothetical protein NPIL_340811 [Nephila pilipes]
MNEKMAWNEKLNRALPQELSGRRCGKLTFAQMKGSVDSLRYLREYPNCYLSCVILVIKRFPYNSNNSFCKDDGSGSTPTWRGEEEAVNGSESMMFIKVRQSENQNQNTKSDREPDSACGPVTERDALGDTQDVTYSYSSCITG